MKAVIIGSGRIGTFVGACLLHAGWDVLFIGRSAFLEGIRKNAQLIISDFHGHELSYPYTEDNPSFRIKTEIEAEDIESGTYVLVTVKRLASEEVAEQFSALDVEGIPFRIISLQNGIGSKDIFSKHFPTHQTVSSGIFGANVIKIDDHHYHLATSNPVILERFIGVDELEHAIVHGPAKPFLSVQICDNIDSVAYGKLLLNLNNAVNSLTGLTLKEELGNRSCRKVLAYSMHEAIDVMYANGIYPSAMSYLMQPRILPYVMRLPNWIYTIVAASSLHVDESARSSMWDDLSSGRKTEIEFLNGEIVALAKKANVEAPINQKVLELVQKAEKEGKSPCYPPDELLSLVCGE